MFTLLQGVIYGTDKKFNVNAKVIRLKEKIINVNSFFVGFYSFETSYATLYLHINHSVLHHILMKRLS